jgi:hypothetical protein
MGMFMGVMMTVGSLVLSVVMMMGMRMLGA